MQGTRTPAPRLQTGLLYRWLRHPMYVGVLLAVWATPRMTVGHLLLAAGMTLYILIAMRYEERDLVARLAVLMHAGGRNKLVASSPARSGTGVRGHRAWRRQ